MKTVYLAGPITGQSFEDCTDWRAYVKKKLAPGISGLSPMRAKEYLLEETRIGDHYAEHVLSCQRGIMTRDYYDTRKADLLLANLEGECEGGRVSIGTVMEIAWAHAHRVPIIVVMEDEANVHDHAMIREAIGFRVKTLGEAIDVANAILMDYVS